MLRGKQAEIVRFARSDYDALICDGAIRSGKTSIMMIAFVDWAMRNFENHNFAICGKTVLSAWRNIIAPFTALSWARKRFTMVARRSDNTLTVTATCGGSEVTNSFYLFGGKDESSQDLIQGITLAGVLLDEVALMPESFVNQATARCSVEGSKFWFSCNPGSPEHWFKKNWIDRAAERNALHLHFTMDDNPSLSTGIRARYESMYTGVFYDRYIRGLWVLAEGLVYPMFGASNTAPSIDRDYERYIVSMDYGTLNPTAMLLWGLSGGVWYAVKEYYHSGREGSQRTDDEYYTELCRLCDGCMIDRVIIDPSAASFITLVRRHGLFRVLPAKNDVLPGISDTATALGRGTIKVCDCCTNTIKEFGLYSWDEKAAEDRVIKANDHAMDAIRYFVYTTRLARPLIPDDKYSSPFGG